MKLKKQQAKLERRVRDYHEMCKRSPTGGIEYRKPGSMSGRGRK